MIYAIWETSKVLAIIAAAVLIPATTLDNSTNPITHTGAERPPTNEEGNTMAIHFFGSTGEAYNACQCRDDIATGDLLIIPSERVVGIADAWPIAITAESGELHTPAEGYELFDTITVGLAADALKAFEEDF